MKTAELTGAQLDYWTARAEGHTAFAKTLPYSTNWALAGPLLRKHVIGLDICVGDTGAYVRARHRPCDGDQFYGETPLIAICRAAVHAAFGDEVEDMP